MNRPLIRRLVAEALGTALLLAVVVGSGVMAERLAGGNVAIALLANAIATGAGLYALILVFAPVSGAHFNPAVTLAMCARRQMRAGEGVAYIAMQVLGAWLGVLAAHAMFELPLLQVSTHARSGIAQAWSECVATFGLVLMVFGIRRAALPAAAAAIGAYITAAYWFTASTSFANPAVTVARMTSDTFAGIAPADVPAFVVAQVVGMLLAVGTAAFLFEDIAEETVTATSASGTTP